MKKTLGYFKKSESKNVVFQAASRKRTAGCMTPKQAAAKKEKSEAAESKRNAKEELEARLRVQRGEDGGGGGLTLEEAVNIIKVGEKANKYNNLHAVGHHGTAA
jgi:hypothetical protein